MNMGSGTMWQMAVKALRSVLLNGSSSISLLARNLHQGLIAGVSSGLLVGPLELMMIQQQRKGGSIPIRAREIGVSRIYRGLAPTCGREGLWSIGYLSFPPIIRKHLIESYPGQFVGRDDAARLVASIGGTLVSSLMSHPFDTVKTCMQGDVEKKKYKGSIDSARLFWEKAASVPFIADSGGDMDARFWPFFFR